MRINTIKKSLYIFCLTIFAMVISVVVLNKFFIGYTANSIIKAFKPPIVVLLFFLPILVIVIEYKYLKEQKEKNEK